MVLAHSVLGGRDGERNGVGSAQPLALTALVVTRLWSGGMPSLDQGSGALIASAGAVPSLYSPSPLHAPKTTAFATRNLNCPNQFALRSNQAETELKQVGSRRRRKGAKGT